MYLFLEREGGREKERERNINRLSLTHAPARDQTHNPSMSPDWESNWRPFTLQDDAQPTEPHHSGLDPNFWFSPCSALVFNLISVDCFKLVLSMCWWLSFNSCKIIISWFINRILFWGEGSEKHLHQETVLYGLSHFCTSCQYRHYLFEDAYLANSLEDGNSISFQRKG